MVTPDNASSNAHPQPPTSGDTPIQILTEEHTRILQVLDALETKIAAWEAGAPPDRAFLEKAVEFFRTFADKCHHGKEEDILFKSMVEEMDFPRQAGPVAVLTSEHVAGRECIRKLAEGTAVLGQDPGAAQQVIQSGREYIQLLRIHIARENDVVFPMVEQFLDDADNARLARQFERFEREETGAGVHEASLKLLDELTGTAR
jgi:hemerythrin-like domain-containing protein